MNRHQEQLLQLTAEIDAICRKYGITYYCAGGTVIGAARHGGFIPWDDDIDLYMTRSEFERFRDAFRKESPEHRALECNDWNRDYHSTVPRFIDTESTMFCRYHMLGHAAAGTNIDVFVLDPVPSGYEEQRDIVAKMFAYADLLMPFYIHSFCNNDARLGVYARYRKIMEEKGLEEAIRIVHEELFTLEEDASEYYMLRWGAIPSIFPKSMYGTPAWMPFEGMMLPMPQDWYGHLVNFYGTDWMELPYAESQDTHSNLRIAELPYTEMYRIRDHFFDQNELTKLYWARKNARMEQEEAFRPIEHYIERFKCRVAALEVEKRKRDSGRDLREIFEAGDHEEVVRILQPYWSLQLSVPFAGQLRHSKYYHWINPAIVPVPDEEIRMLLTALMETGRLRVAEKFVRIRQRADQMTEPVRETARLLDRINEAACLYYTDRWEECISFLNTEDPHALPARLRDLYFLAKAKTEPQAVLAELESLCGKDPVNASLRKARADALYACGETARAEMEYRDLMRTCRNGLFWQDIAKHTKIDPIPLEEPARFTSSGVAAAENRLLAEAAAICRERGIPYVLEPQLARRIFRTGNPGHDTIAKVLWMDADGAERFASAVQQEAREDRKVSCWADDPLEKDFVLRYLDTGTFCMDLRTVEVEQDYAAGITIRILRSGYTADRAKQLTNRELMLNLAHVDSGRLELMRSGKKRAARQLQLLRSVGRRGKPERNHFLRSLEEEKQRDPERYYYLVNTRGERPKTVRIDDSLWKETAEIAACGVLWRVPAAVLADDYSPEPDLSGKDIADRKFLLFSSELTWQEVREVWDQNGYDALDWARYIQSRRVMVKYDRKSDEAWDRMAAAADALAGCGTAGEMRACVESVVN
ncbi:MAG: LicD family protein [Mogibacterium sp.]|nr:LicD family protein [Mogibacterium sp.]